MLSIVKDTYGTYYNAAGDLPERHGFRLAVFLVLSAFLCLFVSGEISSVHSMMATGITVLTGFTFTALFSDHALSASGLPSAKAEDSRYKLKQLNTLADYFRIRSSYFISLSIVEIILLTIYGFDLTIPKYFDCYLRGIQQFVLEHAEDAAGFITAAAIIVAFTLRFAINFIYLECLYTFYRLAETMLAVLRMRKDYIASNESLD